jgi:geranylgeranylglycerol-phosphate geranylgeranyltransferase
MQYIRREAGEKGQVSFVRSQLILFQSRKKFGLLYSLATVAGLFCVPSALGAMGMETSIPALLQQTVPLPLISLLVAVGMYILNDLVDADLDRANGKKRPIPSGIVSKRQAWGFIMLTNSAAVALALVTFNPVSMILLAPMLAIGIMYSAPKVALMNRFVIKNLSIAIFYMMCALLGMTSIYGAELAFSNPSVPVHSMAVFGVMIFVGSIVNDLGDVKGDKAEGRHTIPIVMGGERTVKMLMVLLMSMPAISWMLYILTDGVGITTAAAISVIAILALTRMTKMQHGLKTMDADYMRRQHKKWFPLHMVLQTSLAVGVLLI